MDLSFNSFNEALEISVSTNAYYATGQIILYQRKLKQRILKCDLTKSQCYKKNYRQL